MKETITSILRHAVTGLAGLGGLLAAKGWIAPDDTAAVDAAGANLGAALVVIGSAVAVRLLMMGLAKFPTLFRLGAGETKGGTGNGASGGAALLLLVSTAAGFMGCLPSCAPGQLSNVPIRIGIVGPDGSVSYSSKGGLQVEVDASSAK